MKNRLLCNLYVLLLFVVGLNDPAWASSYSWLFVRDSDDNMVTQIKRKFPAAYSVKKSKKYLCVYLSKPEFNAPTDFLRTLSAGNEVYWVTVSSPTEYFQYYHWNKGILLRALDMREVEHRFLFFVDSTNVWSVVSGNPEPWETQTFAPLGDIKPLGDAKPILGADASHVDSKVASDAVMIHFKLEPLWLPAEQR